MTSPDDKQSDSRTPDPSDADRRPSGNPQDVDGGSPSDGGDPAPPDSAVGKTLAEVADLQDQLLRTQAELENFRKRARREVEEMRRFESFRLVRDLLPALDGLERALQSADQSGDFQSLRDGIRMVQSQFHDALRSHAAEQIPADGLPFDPNLHEALSQVPSPDVEPMTILQVIEPGYRIHDRVVRPARVIVSCAPPK